MSLPLRAPAEPHARPDSDALLILSLDVPFIALGRGLLLVTRPRARFAQAWLALGRGPSEPIHDHIWEWNSVRTSLGGTQRTPLHGAQPSESVHDHIWEWNSIPK